jgi:hypothetical protein
MDDVAQFHAFELGIWLQISRLTCGHFQVDYMDYETDKPDSEAGEPQQFPTFAAAVSHCSNFIIGQDADDTLASIQTPSESVADLLQ